ncbi:MAG TPA: ABC transporter permease [Nocardioides sp.]|uniref:ABC transporter permease n=1 Tax=uncultured Nocardioides sp. TaxID=198441 RepID=UPI00262C9F2D|nr:ABC transporter permease [uncultured Nocardioides sp.]HRD62409.1 ABC transporter permease [Nocardioides sp.]HRI95443.1 ABC transporter permease [Nocardioides sp.]HRK45926.1 ABC transporter permease [Nocardioides sp.]
MTSGATVTAVPAATRTRSGGAAPRLLAAVRPLGRLVLTTVTVLFFASVITFALGALSKSNPAATVLGETATEQDIATMNHQFGLDQPVVERYLTWLGGALQGDLGKSWFTTVPVADSIKQALPVDLSIALLALVLAILIGASAGIVAALRAGGFVDRSVTVVCSFVATLPPFVIGIALIVLLAVKARLLPAGGYVPFDVDPLEWLRFSILPALALSIEVAANIARQLRTSLVGALQENYAVGAEMRGFSRRRVLFGHVLRNAISPTLAVIGMALPLIIGGAVMTEKLFNLPGIAQLALQSASKGDVPVVLGTLLVTAVIVLIGSLMVNALQVLLDPAARRAHSLGGAR